MEYLKWINRAKEITADCSFSKKDLAKFKKELAITCAGWSKPSTTILNDILTKGYSLVTQKNHSSKIYILCLKNKNKKIHNFDFRKVSKLQLHIY